MSENNLIWGEIDIDLDRLPRMITPVKTSSHDIILLNNLTFNQIVLTSTSSSSEAFGEFYYSYRYYLNGSLIPSSEAKKLLESLYYPKQPEPEESINSITHSS